MMKFRNIIADNQIFICFLLLLEEGYNIPENEKARRMEIDLEDLG